MAEFIKEYLLCVTVVALMVVVVVLIPVVGVLRFVGGLVIGCEYAVFDSRYFPMWAVPDV